MNLPDFDELKALAETNPDELERLRRDMIEEVIASAANEDIQRRLRGLQFKIDATVRVSRTPMAACLKLSGMMHESLLELRDCLIGEGRRPQPDTVQTRGAARILPLDEARALRQARRVH